MLKKTKLIIAALVLAAALITGTGVYGLTAAFAANPTSTAAAQSTTTTPASPAAAQDLRAQILEMLKDHMGLTGAQAEQLATTMAEQMQKNGGANALDLLKQCNEMDAMMNGTDMMDGTNNMMNGTNDMMNGTNDMMNGTGTHESHHQSTTTTVAN